MTCERCGVSASSGTCRCRLVPVRVFKYSGIIPVLIGADVGVLAFAGLFVVTALAITDLAAWKQDGGLFANGGGGRVAL
jgi:hypothetical protein